MKFSLHKTIRTQLEKSCYPILPTEIKYELLNSGKVRATLKTIRSPKGVENVIYNGGSLSLTDSYESCISIEYKSIKDLYTTLKSRISYTEENISTVEKNVKTLEFNNLLAEVSS